MNMTKPPRNTQAGVLLAAIEVILSIAHIIVLPKKTAAPALAVARCARMKAIFMDHSILSHSLVLSQNPHYVQMICK
jgi:hypothetical protein